MDYLSTAISGRRMLCLEVRFRARQVALFVLFLKRYACDGLWSATFLCGQGVAIFHAGKRMFASLLPGGPVAAPPPPPPSTPPVQDTAQRLY